MDEEMDDIGQLLVGHTHNVLSIAFSPEGKYLATGSQDETAKIWDVETGALLATLPAGPGPIDSIAFSPDGKILATSSYEVRLWDTILFALVRNIKRPTSSLSKIAFSTDGKILASGWPDRIIWLFDPSSGNLLRKLVPVTNVRLESTDLSYTSIVFSPDGQCIAAGTLAGVVKVWNTATWDEVKHGYGIYHPEEIRGIAFSPDGKMLASAGYDETVKLWDMATHKVLRTWKEAPNHLWLLNCVAFSRGSGSAPPMIAAGANDGTLRLWDWRSGSLAYKFLSPKGSIPFSSDSRELVFSTAFSPDGRRIAAGLSGNRAYIIDFKKFGSAGRAK